MNDSYQWHVIVHSKNHPWKKWKHSILKANLKPKIHALNAIFKI